MLEDHPMLASWLLLKTYEWTQTVLRELENPHGQSVAVTVRIFNNWLTLDCSKSGIQTHILARKEPQIWRVKRCCPASLIGSQVFWKGLRSQPKVLQDPLWVSNGVKRFVQIRVFLWHLHGMGLRSFKKVSSLQQRSLRQAQSWVLMFQWSWGFHVPTAICLPKHGSESPTCSDPKHHFDTCLLNESQAGAVEKACSLERNAKELAEENLWSRIWSTHLQSIW